MSRDEWKKNEVLKWMNEMKNNSKYDHSYHSVKTGVLLFWLRKTFKSTSHKEAKQFLYECEEIIEPASEDNQDIVEEEVEEYKEDVKTNAGDEKIME